MQVDAIIRYNRCFKRNRDKFRIPGEWVECRGEDLRSAHTGILAALDNQLQDVPEGREEEAILAVARPAATDDIFAIASFATLQDLADHFTKLLREEMSREALGLRELARRISFC